MCEDRSRRKRGGIVYGSSVRTAPARSGDAEEANLAMVGGPADQGRGRRAKDHAVDAQLGRRKFRPLALVIPDPELELDVQASKIRSWRAWRSASRGRGRGFEDQFAPPGDPCRGPRPGSVWRILISAPRVGPISSGAGPSRH